MLAQRPTNLIIARKLHKSGIAKAISGDIKCAINDFKCSIDAEPGQPAVWADLGTALLETKDFYDAVAAFNQVIAIKGESFQALVDLGNALRAAGDSTGAIDALQRATNLLPAIIRDQAMFKSILVDAGASIGIDGSSYALHGTDVPYPFMKLVVAGSSDSDKTPLVQRFCTNTFITDHKMTIGAAFSIKDILFDTGMSVKLQIWDFATEERFRFLLGDYCRGAAGALVCFNVTDYESFKQVRDWITIIRKETNNIPILLVGTKYDLPNHQVPYELAVQYANDANCIGVAYCSTTTAENVEETFVCIAKWMIHQAFTINEAS
nr:GTP-binding protein [Candidatus Sigynarchaeota archaeon]